MKILAICGSYRKGKTIDTLIDKAIEGIKLIVPNAQVEKIYLIDKKIEYCKGCMACFHYDPEKEIGQCIIQDDMKDLCQKLNAADGYIFGTPIFDATVTAIMKSFIERFSWILAKPGKWPIDGCPTPRTKQKKLAILILSTSIVPNIFRFFCDDATKFFKENLPCMLNAKISGSLFAGAVGTNTPKYEQYFNKAISLGKTLAKNLSALNPK